MSVAKHRHESIAKPAGRFVLYFDTCLTVAEEMVASDSVVKRQPMKCLSALSTAFILQATMLADAADARLVFARRLDDEETDNAELTDEVAEYLARLQRLFT